ncbi:hypothetical protein J2764_005208 [Agrobacterium tumefaciens]|nr:hypothetical protein [Agrobacterium tumefaciens]
MVLVPKPTTPDEALALIRSNLGRNTVRVGITQYPAGLGIVEAGQLKPDMVDACENIRMGTALFAKVWRIVMKWYGNPTAADVLPQVMDDAIIAWQGDTSRGRRCFGPKIPARGKLHSLGLSVATSRTHKSILPHWWSNMNLRGMAMHQTPVRRESGSTCPTSVQSDEFIVLQSDC